MTFLKDIGWLVLIVFFLPLLAAAGLVSVVVIVGRQLYWWARGNTTATSRPAPRERWWAPWRRSASGDQRSPSLSEAPPVAADSVPSSPIPATHT
jgi:hypothetical protein